jgi:hypothetical protein
MKMNHDANIAKDQFKKCNFFLSLLKGEDMEGWVNIQDDWLESVSVDQSIIPWQMNEWEVMEKEFKKAFIDYAAHKKANNKLWKLKMEKGNVDAYIARFQQLAHQGGHSIDELEILQRFAMGLPQNLVDKCYELHDPDTFEQWVMSAQ